jgi:hypothetical protein
MRWHVSFAEKLKKIVFKVFGCLIILLHDMRFGMLLETTFKQVERGVISPIEYILDILFHGHFEFSAGIRFPDFESAVAES